MSWWKAFWAACITTLLGLSLWHNRRVYRTRSWTWVSFKSVVDVSLVIGLAMRVPVLLCGYVILWLTKPLQKKPVLRTTVGAILGIAVGFFSGFAMEVIVVAGVFAMDMVTGGIWHYWQSIGNDKLDWKAELGLRRKKAA
jgi:hypothetical protein